MARYYGGILRCIGLRDTNGLELIKVSKMGSRGKGIHFCFFSRCFLFGRGVAIANQTSVVSRAPFSHDGSIGGIGFEGDFGVYGCMG